MKDELCRYTLRVKKELLDKFGYIAEYEGRTKNRELEQMIIAYGGSQRQPVRC